MVSTKQPVSRAKVIVSNMTLHKLCIFIVGCRIDDTKKPKSKPVKPTKATKHSSTQPAAMEVEMQPDPGIATAKKNLLAMAATIDKTIRNSRPPPEATTAQPPTQPPAPPQASAAQPPATLQASAAQPPATLQPLAGQPPAPVASSLWKAATSGAKKKMKDIPRDSITEENEHNRRLHFKPTVDAEQVKHDRMNIAKDRSQKKKDKLLQKFRATGSPIAVPEQSPGNVDYDFEFYEEDGEELEGGEEHDGSDDDALFERRLEALQDELEADADPSKIPH